MLKYCVKVSNLLYMVGRANRIGDKYFELQNIFYYIGL